VLKWSEKKKLFDDLFRDYNGNKRNFEMFNKYFSGARDSLDLENLLIIPLMRDNDLKKLRLILQIDLDSAEELDLGSSFKPHNDGTNRYSPYVKVVSLSEIDLIKNQIKSSAEEYQSYQSNYDYLKPVF
jgi:hypothetical protein